MTSRRKAVRTLKLRHHKATGQAYAVLNGKAVYFGPYGAPGVEEQYHRTIAEWHAKAAFPPPEHLAQRPGETKVQWRKRLTQKQKDELEAWYKQFHWHSHPLRHNAATFLRKEFGLETARIILGHRSSAITEVYAEMDQQKALEAIVRVG